MASIDTKLVLVQALAHGEGYGLELIDRVRDLTGGQVVLVQGRVYPVLRAIEAEGLATSFESVPLAQRGGRSRRYYRLTAAGRRVAQSQADEVMGLFNRR